MPEVTRDVAHWLASARAGSAEALGQALEACRGYLLAIAQRQLEPELQAKGGASDLVQETFLKAHQHFDRFHGNAEAELLMWLRRLLLNNLVDFRRLYYETEKRQAGREVELEAGDSSGPRGGGLAGAEPTPSNLAMEHEKAQLLTRTLERLPADYRQVLILRYQEERSFEEIAGLMHRSVNAVRKLWARAVERLQDEWESPS
jgi:RNA polymerase sigma-70 factor (ECF subfamily)